jgi:DNA-binding transcriptional regulator LsrR (DeoR family)
VTVSNDNNSGQIDYSQLIANSRSQLAESIAARNAEILRLHDEGQSLRQIARSVGLSKTLVHKTLNKLRPVIIPHEGSVRVPINPDDCKTWTHLSSCENAHDVVYQFLDAEEHLLYVGVTVRPKYRWDFHSRSSYWWDDVAFVELTCCNTRRDALDLEKKLIQTLHPAYNKMHATGEGAA